MNKARRRQIADVQKRVEGLEGILEELKSMVEAIKDEEQEYLDNIPENLQGSERYELAENVVENLDNAYELLDEIDIEDLLGYLEEAKQ